MRRGRPRKPSISVENIEATLKTLGHSAPEVPEAVALQNLALVDLYLENPAHPQSEDLRGWAVRSLLIQFITNALSEQRRFFDLPPASIREKRRTALERIQQDSLCSSDILMGWSLLFYRYVRSELVLTVRELADFTHIHERTLRRYRQDSFLRLRDRLTEAEWEARQVNQRRVLRAGIPEKIPKLIERDSELNLVIGALEKIDTPHFIITGAAGIGKSAFAAAVANRMIQNEELDYVIWIAHPRRFADIQHTIEDTLLPYPGQADIGKLLLEYRTLVVIDDAQSLIIHSEEWLNLLKYLNHAMLIICNREHVLFPHPVTHIPMQELSQSGMYELLSTYLQIDLVDSSLQEQIWQTVAGNPRAVDYAVRQIVNGNTIQFGNAGLHSIYDDLFDKIDDSQKIAWVYLTAMPPSIHHESLFLIVHSNDNLNALFNYDLIEALDDTNLFRLAPSARQYIALRIETDKNITIDLSEHTPALIEHIASSSSMSAASTLLALLSCSWLDFEIEDIVKALNACDTHLLSMPELRQWWRLLAQVNDSASLALLLRKAVAARRLDEHEQAFSILQKIIKASGQSGDFMQQAAARYELAVLHQMRSEFDRAESIYRQLEVYLAQNTNSELAGNIYYQRARIAIENHKPQKALNYLETHQSTLQDGILKCEAYLLMGMGKTCRDTAHPYLKRVDKQPTLAASIYTIIGRSYQQEGLLDDALDYLSAALALTERFSTDFDLARSRCNMASLYLQQSRKHGLDEAENLLRKAQAMQKTIQDSVGLLITERNLQHLHLLRLNAFN
jgi:tetratricopeptide (TPR) repeat protein